MLKCVKMEVSHLRNELNRIVVSLATQCVVKLIRLRSMKRKRNRRIWVKDWISRRQVYGASNSLLKEMREEDLEAYKNHVRLPPEKFDELLSKINDKIQKRNTHMRNAIPARTKLEITLRYLATGDSYISLEALYRVGKSTISQFIPEVCSEIGAALKDFMKVRLLFNIYKDV